MFSWIASQFSLTVLPLLLLAHFRSKTLFSGARLICDWPEAVLITAVALLVATSITNDPVPAELISF